MRGRRCSVAVLMAVVAAAAAESALLPCWLFDEFSPPAPFEVRDLTWGFWPVFLLVPPGMVAAIVASGPTRRFFAAATVAGLILASAHVAATRLAPRTLDRATGRVHAFIDRQLPAFLAQELLRREFAGESLTAWHRSLDLIMALPTIGLSLAAGGIALRRGPGVRKRPSRHRPDTPEAP